VFKIATMTIPAFSEPQSGLRPLGLAPGSVGVVVPVLTGPFTPPLEGVLVAEPVVEPDPFVSALPVMPDAPSDLPADIGTFGLVEFGDALWFGAGVGEPKLSYCCWAEAMLLMSRATEARITECIFMFASFGSPRDPQPMPTRSR
jgi:hypothetical protein